MFCSSIKVVSFSFLSRFWKYKVCQHQLLDDWHSPIYGIETIRYNRYRQNIFASRLELSFLLSSRLVVLSSNTVFFLLLLRVEFRYSLQSQYIYTLLSCSRSLIAVFRSSSTYIVPVNFFLLKVDLVHSPSPHDIPISSLNFCTVCSKLLIDYYRILQTSWDHSYKIDYL